jgi:hypothetical protein
MKNILFKICLISLSLFGAINCVVASELPKCSVLPWHNCFGASVSDEVKYIGDWKDGKYNGKGMLAFANGTNYTGQFKNGALNGQGTFTLASGVIMEGGFKDNEPNGPGTLTLASGDIIEGDWKGGEMIGIQTSLDGTKKEGVFRNGKFQIGASASYAPVPKVKSKQVIASGPVITEYKGRIVASKYRDKKGTLSFNCPQGVVSFTSMEWPHKGQTSAQFTYGGGSSTIRGKLNKESKVFEGDLKQGEYFILHMKGVIKEDRAEGSVWIEIVNFPVYNTNGLCVGNFIAYPSR